MRSIASLLLAFLACPAHAQDADRGRLLYETHCGGCHYERVHDRARSDIKDLPDLRDTVERWAQQTKYRFSAEDLDDVVEYLNRSHYRIGLALREAQAPAPALQPSDHHHSFGDAQKWAHVFDDPSRDAWQKPHEVIAALGLPPDAVVADLGAGTGYFSARLANMLPKGRVYAVDIEPDLVKYLGERAKREGLSNLAPVLVKPDDPRLPEKVDLVLLVDVYHHIEDRSRYFGRLAPSLKPGGRVAIIDFRMDAENGPPRAARIAPDKVRAEMAAAGFVPQATSGASLDFLPEQYFLIFSRR